MVVSKEYENSLRDTATHALATRLHLVIDMLNQPNDRKARHATQCKKDLIQHGSPSRE